jgi:hypothetical protein
LKTKKNYVFTKVSPKEYFGQEKSPY